MNSDFVHFPGKRPRECTQAAAQHNEELNDMKACKLQAEHNDMEGRRCQAAQLQVKNLRPKWDVNLTP